MKLRIKGNTIRLRLMQTEVTAFEVAGKVVETTDFGFQQLTYQLLKTDDLNIKATFDNQTITIFVPEKIGEKWATSNQVGMEGVIKLSEEKVLKILVEKDFKCLTDRPNEDESDAYPHPKEGSIEC
ncbi:MAG: DUF7009 family protein [Saprospiraceae bacterium]